MTFWPTTPTSTATPLAPSGEPHREPSLEQDYTLSLKEGWFQRVETPLRERPAPLTRGQLDGLLSTERLRYEEARSVWHANIGPILTPQMQAVLAELDDIVETNRQDGDKVKGAAVLTAYPGLGKTTLAVAYGAEFHRRQADLYGARTPGGDERIPVAYIGLTSNTTIRSLNSMLCRFYGHPGAERGNATQLGNRAADCVLSCLTKLVIVDDVHFLDMNRRDGREVANHFKWLSNQFPVTFLFVGVGLRERGLLTEGLTAGDSAMAQTARRWTTLSLAPFEIQTDEGRRTWRRLLLAIERDLVLADTRPGDAGRRPRRLPLRPHNRALRLPHDSHRSRLPACNPIRDRAPHRRGVRRCPQ